MKKWYFIILLVVCLLLVFVLILLMHHNNKLSNIIILNNPLNGKKNTKTTIITTITSNNKMIETKTTTSTASNNNSISTTSKIVTTTQASQTKLSENESLINQIYNAYGYKVSYDNEAFYYGGEEAITLTNQNEANRMLKELYNKSANFPNNFFRELKTAHGFRVLLYEDVNGAAGVADYEFGDDYKLALSANYVFSGRTFYHEVWHIMERYIEYYGGYQFHNWFSLNPEGFRYGNTDDNTYTAIDYANPKESICFVSPYSRSNDREDRAELFADLMFRPYQKSYMASGYCINHKANILINTISKYFSNSSGANWERWVVKE